MISQDDTQGWVWTVQLCYEEHKNDHSRELVISLQHQEHIMGHYNLWLQLREYILAGNGERLYINTLTSKQNGRHFLDDIFKCIFLNDCCRILIEILLEIVLNGAIDNEP